VNMKAIAYKKFTIISSYSLELANVLWKSIGNREAY
jgi:hypothetical protein